MAGGISVLSWSRATEEREQFARLIGQGLATPRRAGSCGETAGPGHGGGSGELASHPLGVRGETNSCSTHPGPCPTRKRVPVRNAASGHGRKFVGGSGPGGGVGEVEAAGGVEGVFGGADCGACG